MVQLISTEILPYANFIPKEFVGQIMTMLNKGSIHSQSSSFTGMVPEWQKIRCLNLLESFKMLKVLILIKTWSSMACIQYRLFDIWLVFMNSILFHGTCWAFLAIFKKLFPYFLVSIIYNIVLTLLHTFYIVCFALCQLK